MLALRQVTKRFGDTEAIAGVDVEVGEGTTTALIGPSGCGKSTLLRMIVGLVWPDSGDVEVEGVRVTPESVQQVRRGLGYVIQDGGLFPHLTARENTVLAAREFGWEATRIQERLMELVALTHFPEEGLDRYPLQLSGGQRQRVALMRALMLGPTVLLLDEPFAALDPMIRRELQEELGEIFGTLATTVLLVTHDLGEAAYLSDELVLLGGGKVVQRGTLDDLLDRPASDFVGAFVRAQNSPRERAAERRR